MTILNALIFGIVEGLSEFLPISSTGHLILTAQILKVSQTDFLKSFEIAIQLGAIFSVVILYYKSLFRNWQITKKVSEYSYIPCRLNLANGMFLTLSCYLVPSHLTIDLNIEYPS